jgi:hypothetical protein
MRDWSCTSLFYQQIHDFNEVEGKELRSPFYREVPKFNEEVLHEGEELHPPFFISKYLSSMRKSFVRGRSFTSLF